MLSIHYDKNDNIIRVIRSGEINLTELIESFNRIGKQFNHLPYLLILDDFRDSSIRYTPEELKLILDDLKLRSTKYKKIISALLVTKFVDTATSLLYEEIAKATENYIVKVFSTEESAIPWLKGFKNSLEEK